MASAYAWCKGRGQCPELELALAVRSYGIEAVLGRRHLFAKEINAFKAVLAVYDTFRSYARIEDLDQWIQANPEQSKWWFALLQRIEDENVT